MLEIVIYISLSAILLGFAHILSAIKSGCFYAVKNGKKPDLLAKYIDNMHMVQTPYWYCLFGGFFFMILSVYRIINPENDVTNILLDIFCAYLVIQGTSAAAGPWYQGFINVGGDRPFTDENEKHEYEFANPLTNKTQWKKKFWYGKRRWYLMPFGFLMIIASIIIMWYASR